MRKPLTGSTKRRFRRFEDDNLQATLIAMLDQAAVRYRRDRDGAVVFDKSQQTAVMDAVHRVRDAQFPWYLLLWRDEREAERYGKILQAAGLPFYVERWEMGVCFLVRREDRDWHTELFDELDSPLTK